MKWAVVLSVLFASGCASTKEAKFVEEARLHYANAEYSEATSGILRPEVVSKLKNRVLHYLNLGSAAYARGSFAEAAVYFQKARDKSNELRSGWSLFQGADYAGTPVEYSWIHAYLALSYYRIAVDGFARGYSIPEIKDGKEVLVSGENVADQNLDARGRQQFLQKARAEMLAWDSHLQNVGRSIQNPKIYHEDAYGRLLGILIHAEMNDRVDQRIAESLAKNLPGLMELQSPGSDSKTVQTGLEKWITRKSKNQKAILVESGMLQPLKRKKVVIGLSTLFKNIQDPQLRGLMERIGFEVIIRTAPEFGLVLFGGALVGAISGKDENDDDSGPVQFTDAIDRGIGFQMEFPWMTSSAAPKNIEAIFTSVSATINPLKIPLTTVMPLQSFLHEQYQIQKDNDVLAKAVSVGAQYLGVLIPAIVAWKAVDGKEGSGFRKLAIMAGFLFAKKAIDNANEADLRSWNWLPKDLIFGSGEIPPGNYQAQIRFEEDGRLKLFTQDVKVNESDRILFFKKPTVQVAP